MDGPAWDVQGWYGGDYNKLWFRTEGLRLGDVTVDARAELLGDRVFSRWWSAQAGVRHDVGEGPARNWLALGVAASRPTSSRSRPPATSAMPAARRDAFAPSMTCCSRNA